jgi:uncharacterized protein YxjI
MALFGRRERREERRGAVHYRMREKLVAIGDDYWIEDDAGQRVFKVNGKALRVRDTLIFEDASGNELLKIQSGCSTSATRWRSRTRTATRWRQ